MKACTMYIAFVFLVIFIDEIRIIAFFSVAVAFVRAYCTWLATTPFEYKTDDPAKLAKKEPAYNDIDFSRIYSNFTKLPPTPDVSNCNFLGTGGGKLSVAFDDAAAAEKGSPDIYKSSLMKVAFSG